MVALCWIEEGRPFEKMIHVIQCSMLQLHSASAALGTSKNFLNDADVLHYSFLSPKPRETIFPSSWFLSFPVQNKQINLSPIALMHIYSLRTLYSPLITLTPEIVQNSDYQPIPHNLRTIASTCLQLCWDFMMGVLECSGTMWCYTSIDFICRGLNQSQLCTVWARNKKWLAFYP